MTTTAAESKISFEVALTVAEVRTIMFRSLLLRLPRLLGFWAIVTIVLGAFRFGGFIATGRTAGALYFFISMIVGLVAILTALTAYVLIVSAKHAAKRAALGASRYDVSDRGVAIDGPTGRSELNWSAFGKLNISERAISIRLRHADYYVVIPKRCVAAQDWAPLTALFSSHLS